MPLPAIIKDLRSKTVHLDHYNLAYRNAGFKEIDRSLFALKFIIGDVLKFDLRDNEPLEVDPG